MMKSSKILDNRPQCPYCLETSDYKLKAVEVDVALIDDEKYFEFIMRCRSCGNKSYYFLDLDMENRISVDKDSDRYCRFTSEEKYQDIDLDWDDE